MQLGATNVQLELNGHLCGLLLSFASILFFFLGADAFDVLIWIAENCVQVYLFLPTNLSSAVFKGAWVEENSGQLGSHSQVLAGHSHRTTCSSKLNCPGAGAHQITSSAHIDVVRTTSWRLDVHGTSCCDYMVADDLRLLLISAVIVSTCSSFEWV